MMNLYNISICFFLISSFVIFFAMIGYPLLLFVLSKILKRQNKKDYTLTPFVTVLVVAHDEEKVIYQKLENLMSLDYPVEKINFIVASDYSTDSTNQIVKEFSKCHYNVHLVEVQEHKGKTHAQNEAVKQISTEFIVFTDANSIIRKNAIRELMASFTGDDIIYVSGKLEYVSNQINAVSKMESGYWKLDLWMRNAESNIYTITAGNGALYACRRSWYHFFEPIKCHDSAMPLFYGKLGKRAIYNADAIAYEKTGETAKDEYKRKTRMNREILKNMIPKLNLLRSFWFSIFYFGHRVCRYSLWWAHLVLLISNILLCFVEKTFFWNGLLVLQFICYIGAFLQYIKIVHFRISHWMFYYVMTILAQWHGVINIFTGRSKPIWEKAKSTR